MHGVDYYRVLGVSQSATSAQIKASYKLLAKKYHPDHNGDVRKMASLNEAYRVLSDPHARQRYNQTLDIAQEKPRRRDASDGYVYTPHNYQHTSASSRPRPQSTRSRSYSPPKQRQSTLSKWAWAATFAILLGVLLGAGMHNPIPNDAASTLGAATPGTVQQAPSTTQPTPSNTLNDTAPANTPSYSDPTSQSSTQSDTNTAQEACSQYRKHTRSYENCVSRSNNCNSNSYNYFGC